MKLKFRIPTLDTTVWIAIGGAVVVAILFIYWLFHGTSITVNNEPAAGPVSALSGVSCTHATKRPIAVMLASDPEARPLSGIGQADMVFEMPVTPNGITRMMAVFQCSTPKELGSVRSARQDFIPLAQGLDAILAHWGGERDALAALDSHVIDNVDAMKYEGTTFYRKAGIPAPHNGFTTLQLIRDRADQLGYSASVSTPPYPHASTAPERNIGALADTASVSWPQNMDVRFSYDPATDTYLRWRGGAPEIDKTTGQQVRVSVVIVMQTDASFLRDQYISVRTVGHGVATVWQGGRRINSLWKKPTATDMLAFTDSNGASIQFQPGTIWVLIDAPLPAVTP